MSLQKFDGEDLIHLLLTDALPCELVRRLSQNVVGEAVASLWNFYNRRLPDGGQWAFARSPNALRDFSSMLATAQGLFAACCDLQDHELVTSEERNALEAVIAMAEALGFTRRRQGAMNERAASAGGAQFPRDFEGEVESQHMCLRDVGCYDLRSPTDFRHGSTYFRVRLRNLSHRGVMIEGPSNLLAGDNASVKISGQWIEGYIVWSLPGRCGLNFGRPYREAEEPKRSGANGSASNGVFRWGKTPSEVRPSETQV